MNTNTKRFDRRQILKAAGGLGIMAFGASMSPARLSPAARGSRFTRSRRCASLPRSAGRRGA